MPSVKLNTAANLAARVWTALVHLAFVPLYVRYLGIEAYGLIGVFTSLLALFALLDLGLDGANFLVSAPRAVWFRSFGLGGENFTQALVKHFQLTREQAEELKRNPAKARRYSLYCASQEPLFVQLVSEIERSLISYSRGNATEPAERLYGVGGAFQTHGLLRYLRCGK